MEWSHRKIAIIETAILLAMIGAIIIWMILRGAHLGPISFITTR